MKTILMVLIAGLMIKPALGQDIDVKVDTRQLEASVERIAETAVEHVIGSFGNDHKHEGQLQEQSTQEVEIPLTSPGERGTLNVESRNGRIKIVGYDGRVVKVKMTKYGKKVDKNTSKDGMRLISNGGFNFEASERNNNVKVENEGWNSRVDFEIQVPKNFDLKLRSYNNGHINVEDIDGELDVESYNGPITLLNIGGSASASTYNGAVKATFTSVTADVPMNFDTYNGDVDITVPAGTKFSTKMRTNREIYTDFESFSLIQTKPTRNRDERRGGTSIKFENWVQGALNGGGAEVTMKTRNGNIYIRKN
ncbi:hypothetical protein [Roseivirga sp. E12]|uniref:hypothetical protein n=1 Tax=Roseivirga sp. E12 TaxID=2819237 RepID=UPI001ABC4027|nr:hypothetical protein [Roseivirga sp. E12]MBO3700310.1 hypothetical protein [Roseivirga sp. E12]